MGTQGVSIEYPIIPMDIITMPRYLRYFLVITIVATPLCSAPSISKTTKKLFNKSDENYRSTNAEAYLYWFI